VYKKALIERLFNESGGVARLKPAWVSRVFLPPGKRLGLSDGAYDVGERGYITERWLASTTPAENPVPTENEGLSFLASDPPVLLKEAVELCPETILGDEYSKTHKGLGRLPKIFDNGDRLPFHIHQMQKDASKLGKKSKEESYYFPENVPLGPHPETFFGLHPYIVREKLHGLIVECLEDWDHSDALLALSRAYLNVPGEGFHLPPGILHAPGSALTIELQEDSDVAAMFQGKLAHKLLDKAVLTRDVPPAELEAEGMMALVRQLDWEANGDPYFYENHHTPPVPVEGSKQLGGEEWWIFYNTRKYSGKKLVVKPGQSYFSKDKGVYSILVWDGEGTFGPVGAGSLDVRGRSHDKDEIIVTHDAAVKGIEVANTGAADLSIIKFFGPDINDDAPFLRKYP
jgi:mannose-6-phosphate isomerase class I